MRTQVAEQIVRRTYVRLFVSRLDLCQTKLTGISGERRVSGRVLLWAEVPKQEQSPGLAACA
jgi:hypothetical protein